MAGRFLILSLAAALGVGATAQTLKGSAEGAQLQLDRVPMSVAAEAIMRQVSDRPFVLCDSVLNDSRPVSLRLEPFQLNLRAIGALFANYGFRLVDRDGVLYVCDASNRAPALGSRGSGTAGAVAPWSVAVPEAGDSPVGLGAAPWGTGGVLGRVPPLGPVAASPAAPQLLQGPGQAVYVAQPAQLLGYRPDYVAPEALLSAVEPLFPDVTFSVARGSGQRPALFASGPLDAVDRWEKMAKYLDRPPEAVEVQAIIVEVTDGGRTGFGVSVVLDALRSTIGVTVAGPVLENQLSFRSGSFDAVLSAVASTTTARVLSSPRLRGRSGEKLRLQVGNDVPTLAGVIDRNNGSTQQSIQYRSSGTIFEVVPEVLGKRVGLAVHQELSAFVATETGVAGSPTLTTRSLDTTLDLESGEWAVIGGLTSNDDQTARESLLGLVPIGKVRTRRRSELVLLVNVKAVGLGSRSAAVDAAGGRDAAARN